MRRFAKGLEPRGDFVSKQGEQNDEKPVQQSLLGENEMQTEGVQEVTTFVKNFSLFAAHDASEELQDALEQWLRWQ